MSDAGGLSARIYVNPARTPIFSVPLDNQRGKDINRARVTAQRKTGKGRGGDRASGDVSTVTGSGTLVRVLTGTLNTDRSHSVGKNRGKSKTRGMARVSVPLAFSGSGKFSCGHLTNRALRNRGQTNPNNRTVDLRLAISVIAATCPPENSGFCPAPPFSARRRGARNSGNGLQGDAD